MSTTRCQSAQEAFDQIDEMNDIAACVLVEPQRSIWTMMCDNMTSAEMAEALNARKAPGEAPITERNVRYHRAQCQIKVRKAYVDFRQGKFRCGVVVERGEDAQLKTDLVAQNAICNVDRCQRKAA